MPGLVIKDFPEELHERLKARAKRHHRSLTREALSILEEALTRPERPARLPPPIKLEKPLTDEFIDRAKREGRA